MNQNDMPLAGKPRACIPCHERKVRCDSAHVGIPCTRCTKKERNGLCRLVPRPEKRKSRRTTSALSRTSHERQPISTVSPEESCERRLNNRQENLELPRRSTQNSEPHSLGQSSSRPSTIIQSHSTFSPVAERTFSDAEGTQEPTGSPQGLETNDSQEGSSLAPPNTRPQYQTPFSNEDSQRIVVEYYLDFNPISILGRALGQPRRRGLVKGPESQTLTAQDQEIAFLSSTDREYIAKERVFELPSKDVCDALVYLFFEHSYTCVPILDRSQFVDSYLKGRAPTFILYGIFITAIPYASHDLLQSIGIGGAIETQTEFFKRARLLCDFGCERNELSLLQGTTLLGSFQYSFEPNRDFRFWLNKAARLAIQMGLHRQNVGDELSPDMHRIYRRIWWFLLQRDVFLVIAGYADIRRLNDEDTDVTPICLEDYVEEKPVPGLTCGTIPPMPHLQKRFFMEVCTLARLGCRLMRLFRANGSLPLTQEVHDLSRSIQQWRASLPRELLVTQSSQEGGLTRWATLIQALGFQLEAALYHSIQLGQSSWGHDTIIWAKKQQLNAVFELGTIFRRAIVLDTIDTAPALLTDCATQLVAFQIHLFMSSSLSKGQLLQVKTDIQALLVYLEEESHRWYFVEPYLKAYKAAVAKIF